MKSKSHLHLTPRHNTLTLDPTVFLTYLSITEYLTLWLMSPQPCKTANKQCLQGVQKDVLQKLLNHKKRVETVGLSKLSELLRWKPQIISHCCITYTILMFPSRIRKNFLIKSFRSRKNNYLQFCNKKSNF